MFTGRRPVYLDSGSLKIQYNRNRYYDYYTGRWLTHDPLGITPNPQRPNRFDIIGQYKDGMSFYEYVRNTPVNRLDPSGLWEPGVHYNLTMKAFQEIVETLTTPKWTWKCRNLMWKRLTKANTKQDRGESSKEFERHYTRPKKENETFADKLKADNDYELYVLKEQGNFRDALSKKTPDCELALQSLGRLDHSLQDFYGHAIPRYPKDPNEPFAAWGVGVTGDPGNRDHFWPASYPGEHPPWWIGEPVNFRKGEGKLRKQAALKYMIKHYDSLLGRWWEICGCWCNCK